MANTVPVVLNLDHEARSLQIGDHALARLRDRLPEVGARERNMRPIVEDVDHR